MNVAALAIPECLFQNAIPLFLPLYIMDISKAFRDNLIFQDFPPRRRKHIGCVRIGREDFLQHFRNRSDLISGVTCDCKGSTPILFCDGRIGRVVPGFYLNGLDVESILFLFIIKPNKVSTLISVFIV